MELILDINKPFNLEYSLDSGQLFICRCLDPAAIMA